MGTAWLNFNLGVKYLFLLHLQFHLQSHFLHMNNGGAQNLFYRLKPSTTETQETVIQPVQEPGVTSQECFTCEHNDLGQARGVATLVRACRAGVLLCWSSSHFLNTAQICEVTNTGQPVMFWTFNTPDQEIISYNRGKTLLTTKTFSLLSNLLS